MSVERYDGEGRIERVFRLVAFYQKGFFCLFVLFGCGCKSVRVCVCVLDKPVLAEKGRLITISKDCDWCTTACHSFFCLQLKYIHLGTFDKGRVN